VNRNDHRPVAAGHAHAMIHASLTLGILVATLVAVPSSAELAPSALLLFVPLIVLAANFWSLPGLLAIGGLSLGLVALKMGQYSEVGGLQAAMIIELIVLLGTAALAFFFHQRSAKVRVIQADHADDTERLGREVLNKIEHEKINLSAARARTLRLESTQALAQALDAEHHFEARVDLVAKGMIQLLNGGDAWFMQPVENGLKITRHISIQGVLPIEGTGYDFDSWVMAKRMGLLVADIEKDVRFKGDTSLDLRSVASAPVVKNDQVVAVIRLGWNKVNAYNHEDLRLLTMLCDVLAASDDVPVPAVIIQG
jgi:hypothetical protein